ncbi:hypothetical protein BDZ89DRAFT_715233 [Hymenopellis radicata]|nr:hypothetical protein BDZ89DRAFT_715233 [Hymenopellis radicata]
MICCMRCGVCATVPRRLERLVYLQYRRVCTKWIYFYIQRAQDVDGPDAADNPAPDRTRMCLARRRARLHQLREESLRPLASSKFVYMEGRGRLG